MRVYYQFGNKRVELTQSKTIEQIKEQVKQEYYPVKPIAILSGVYTFLSNATVSLASTLDNTEEMREGFQRLIDVFIAIAEPILWGYAVAGFILMATSSKEKGWHRIKMVGYAYMGIVLLPTFFAFLRYIALLFKDALPV